MKRRLLILTAGFGEGHNAAARGLAAACDALHGPESARVVDAFDLAAPRLNAITRRSYLALINRAPRLWRRAYRWIDRSKTIVPHSLRLLRRETNLLRQIVAGDAPDAICSTYPIYAFLIAEIARPSPITAPHYNVVTDSISINSLWWRAPCAGWFLPNDESADVLHRAGVEVARLHVLGFPVTPFFAAHAHAYAPPDLEAGAAPRVLYIVNSGTTRAAGTARLLFAQSGWEITVAVGRDEDLRCKLERLARGANAKVSILGWTDQIPRLLMTHHLVISKAGGATTQEAIAARCPMIVNQIVPGQEEGNYELLRRHGIGDLAETPESVMSVLHRAFAVRGRMWRQWREALSSLARINAAHEIVCHVLDEAQRAAEPIPVPLQPESHAPRVRETAVLPAARSAALAKGRA